MILLGAKNGGCTSIEGPDDNSIQYLPEPYGGNLRYLKVVEVTSACAFNITGGKLFNTGASIHSDPEGEIKVVFCW